MLTGATPRRVKTSRGDGKGFSQVLTPFAFMVNLESRHSMAIIGVHVSEVIYARRGFACQTGV